MAKVGQEKEKIGIELSTLTIFEKNKSKTKKKTTTTTTTKQNKTKQNSKNDVFLTGCFSPGLVFRIAIFFVSRNICLHFLSIVQPRPQGLLGGQNGVSEKPF